jgi:hypothetical protein
MPLVLVRAVRPWMNNEHEGLVDVGQEFETSEYRAAELVRMELAIYAVSDTIKIRVVADPPPPAPDPPPPPPSPPKQAQRRRR